MGISKEDQQIIFDKFERASASKRTFTKGGASGFGLGLNYVLHVLEAHHGMVTVIVNSENIPSSPYSCQIKMQAMGGVKKKD